MELRPLSPSCSPSKGKEPPPVRRSRVFLFPPDLRLAATTLVRRVVNEGLHYQPSSLFHAELAMANTVGEQGQSSHQLRLRTTNPAFNRWIHNLFIDPIVPVDPGLEIYAGIFGTVATRPFGIVGIFSWGADAELTTLGGYRLYLDSNLQHRVRSSDEIPSEKFLVENTLRFESPDHRIAFGVSGQLRPLPEPEVRLSLMGTVLFD